jgi:hypothetical protein
MKASNELVTVDCRKGAAVYAAATFPIKYGPQKMIAMMPV